MSVPIAAARRLWQEAIVNPLREGRLRLATWPSGLVWLGAIIGYLYVVASTVTVFATPIRRADELRVVADDAVLPVSFLPLIMCLVVVCLVLVQTAALHLFWPLRLLALMALATTYATFALPAGGLALLVSAASFGGLVLVHLVRIGKRYHPGELAVVALLVLIGLQVPVAITAGQQHYGFDWRGILLMQLMQSLTALASPALIAAGAVFTQLAVASGEAVADEIGRSMSPWWFWGALAASLVWRGVDTTIAVFNSFASLVPTRVTGAVIAVAATALFAFAFVARARRRHRVPIDPGGLGEAFAPVVYLAGLATAAWLVMQAPLLLSREWLRNVLGTNVDILDVVAEVWRHPWSGALVKCATGIALLLYGWWRASKGDPLIGVLAAGFAVARTMSALKMMLGGDPTGLLTVDTTGLMLALNAGTLLTFLGLAVTGRLNQRHATGVLAAALICTVYPLRGLLAEPGTALLGFSTIAALLFGLIWRVLTDGDFTHADTPRLPRESRIVLFLANSLFAATVLAFAALGRLTASGGVDINLWESLGDGYAEALWLAAVLLALLSAIWPRAFQASPGSASV